MPKLFSTLRPICDDPNRKAQFLLLGSASLDLIQGVSDSLAGRIQFVDVCGFSLHVVLQDLRLAHLWVLYPGDQQYPLTDSITALPLRDVARIALVPERGDRSEA